MSNPFDQFDEEVGLNPFDQFDAMGATDRPETASIPASQTRFDESVPPEFQVPRENFEDFPAEPPEYTPFNARAEYDGLPFRDGVQVFNERLQGENVTRYGLANLFGLLPAYETGPDGSRTFITPPTQRLNPFRFGEAKADRTSMAAEGMWNNLVGNFAEIGAAVYDWSMGKDDATRAVQGFFPNTNTEGDFTGALVNEGIPILASSLVAAGLIWRGAAGMNMVARGGLTFVGSEAAAAAASPSEGSTLITGENAYLPILKGVSFEDKDAAERVVAARLNMFAEGLALSGIISTAARGTGALAEAAYGLTARPIVNAVRNGEAPLEKDVVDSVVSKIIDSMNLTDRQLADPALRAELVDNIAQTLRENSEIMVPAINALGENPSAIAVDSMTALIRGVESPTGVGSTLPADGRTIATAEGLRSGQIVRPGSQTQQAASAPIRNLDEQTEAFLRQTGGETPEAQLQTMAEGADALASTGREQVLSADSAARTARSTYEQEARSLVSDLTTDVELASEIERLARVTGTEIDVARTQNLDQVVSQIESAYVPIKAGKNERFNRLQGGAIDVESLYMALRDFNIDTLSDSSQSLLTSTPLRRIAEVFKGGPNATDAERIAAGKAFFDSNPEVYDFGYIYNEIRPELSQLASKFYANNDKGNGAVVRSIINTIDNEMVDFVRRSNPELADAVVEAKRFYSEEYAPFFKDGKLREFADIHDANFRGDTLMNTVDYGDGVERLIETTLSQPQRKSIEQIKNLLERPEAGGNSEAIVDYMISDVMSRNWSSLRASGGADAQVDTLVQGLRDYSRVLRNSFGDKAREMDQFADNLQSLRGRREALAIEADRAEQAFRDTKNSVMNQELSSFLTDMGTETNPILRELSTTSNPLAAFRRVLSSNAPENIDVVRRLIDRSDNLRATNPERADVIQDGMFTAYTTLLRRELFGYGRRTSGNVPALNTSNIQQNEENLRSLFSVGDEVFRDTPEIMETIRLVSGIARQTEASRTASPIVASSPTQFLREASTATNRLIYTLVGPLTRTGTRIRAGAAAVLENAAPDARAVKIMDNLLANPKRLADLMTTYNRQPTDPAAYDMLIRALLEGTTRPTTDDGQNILGAGVEATAEAELSARDGINSAQDLLMEQLQNNR